MEFLPSRSLSSTGVRAIDAIAHVDLLFELLNFPEGADNPQAKGRFLLDSGADRAAQTGAN
jgi:hypothetical protein